MLTAEWDFEREIEVRMGEAFEAGEQRGITLGKQQGIALGEKRGELRGEQRGIDIGTLAARTEVARKMKAEGMDAALISSFTELGIADIEKL